MPTIDAALVNGLLSTPLVLPASVAGALAALFLVLAILALRRAAAGGMQRFLLPVAAIAAAALAGFTVLDRLALDRQAAEQRALIQRNEQLDLSALTPGSVFACLDSGAGEATETACEASVFASPQSTAAAVTYVGARLRLLADVHAFAQDNGAAIIDVFAPTRRALELDRYGIAAHVLAAREGCTHERCAAFTLFTDASALRANLKAQAFDQYVSRHEPAWSAPAAEKQPPAVSEVPVAPAPAAAAEPTAHPLSSIYNFPSAASIPPVSIMNAEPPLPKESSGNAPPAAGAGNAAPADKTPVPPKRPQAQRGQAATTPAR